MAESGQERQRLEGRSNGWLELLAFELLYLLFFLLRFLQSSKGWIADEELHSPSIATLLAAGRGWLHLPEMQYATFCGGCTVETLLVTPFIRLFGPALWIWKGIPLFFGMLVLALAFRLAHRASGVVAARITAASLVFAPYYFTANGMVAFGSHFEVMALVLLGLTLWERQMTAGGLRAPFLFGIASGFSFYFSYTSAFAFPILTLLWWMKKPRDILSKRSLVLAGGLLLGLVPWILTQVALAKIGSSAQQPLVSVYGLGPAQLFARSPALGQRLSQALGWLSWVSMFHPVFPVSRPLPGLMTTVLAVTSWAGTCLLGLRAWKHNEGENQPILPLAFASLVLAYLMSYLFLAPHDPAPGVVPMTSNGMRYLVPMVPLISLCGGYFGAEMLGRTGSLRNIAISLLLLWLGIGLTARLAEIEPDKLSTRALFLSAVEPGTAAFRLQVNAPSTASGQTLRAWAEDFLRGSPSGGYARRIYTYGLGLALGHRIVRWKDPHSMAVELNWLEDLSEQDRRAIVTGVADIANGWGGWTAEDPLEGPTSSLARVLSQLVPELSLELCQELFRFNSGIFAQVLEELRSENDWKEGARLEHLRLNGNAPYANAVGWILGYLSAHQGIVGEIETSSLVLALGRESDRLDGESRRFFLSGAGERLGEGWGHDPRAKSTILQAIDGEYRAIVSESFDRGARWKYWWPRAAANIEETVLIEDL